ncbi:MAG: Nucleoporin nup35 [Marteilia pararefringens]
MAVSNPNGGGCDIPSFCQNQSDLQEDHLQTNLRPIHSSLELLPPGDSPIFSAGSNRNDQPDVHYRPYIQGDMMDATTIPKTAPPATSFLENNFENTLTNSSRKQDTNNYLSSSNRILKDKFRFGMPSNHSMLENQCNSESLNRSSNNSNLMLKSLPNESIHHNSTFFEQSFAQYESNESDNYWITVYGFGNNMMDMIINDFSLIGPIEKIVGEGNWVNLKYYNNIDANQALGRNGRIFADSFMIGVKKCSDKSIINTGNPYSNFNDNKSAISAFSTAKNPPIPLQSKRTTRKSLSQYHYVQNQQGVLERIFSFLFG